jgi:hypothetical protein
MASDFVQTDAGVSVLPLQLKDKTIVMVMSHPQGTKEMYEQAAREIKAMSAYSGSRLKFEWPGNPPQTIA